MNPHKPKKEKKVKIKGVVPIVPDYDPNARDMLKKNLKQMGCEGLLFSPWTILFPYIIHEVIEEATIPMV